MKKKRKIRSVKNAQGGWKRKMAGGDVCLVGMQKNYLSGLLERFDHGINDVKDFNAH